MNAAVFPMDKFCCIDHYLVPKYISGFIFLPLEFPLTWGHKILSFCPSLLLSLSFTPLFKDPPAYSCRLYSCIAVIQLCISMKHAPKLCFHLWTCKESSSAATVSEALLTNKYFRNLLWILVILSLNWNIEYRWTALLRMIKYILDMSPLEI